MTMPGTTHVVRVEGLDAAGPFWDGLPHSLFSSANWLRTGEVLGGTPARYTVVQREGRPSSAQVTWQSTGEMWVYNDPVALLRLGAAELAGHVDEAAATEVAELAGAVERAAHELYPARVSVLPSGYRPGLVVGCADDVPLLLDDLEKDGDPTTAVMHVDDGDDRTVALLKERGYIGLTAAGDSVLELDPAWGGLEDYAAAERRRGKRVRHEVDAFRAAGATIRQVDVAALGARHAELHAAHLRRYGHDATEDSSRRLISAIQQWPAGRPLVLEIVQDGTVEGFLVAYEWGDELFASMLGISPEAPYGYFNLIYYEPIRRAVAAGLSRIRFGPGTYQAKRQRGCTVRPLTSYVRVPDRWEATVARLASLLDAAYRREMGASGG
ncbi:GNAT family N-acetyltransferase [Streptomyces sp. NBC_00249]|uniref:GNAT family N-acetyltransferase n=1 Tax=Streptomyces sp. NBC_00249 TaxID=2975690 RepID=UPI00225A31DD|nr:GNAT family N-acetyltransferase [Streptomyces sp. NBC_00249]MCX5195078.1 GNAT family N-acetyltransferase [Streptomyces sp. NBC_00249]